MRTEDTQETGDPYARARLIQWAIGLGFAAVGVWLVKLGHINEGLGLVLVGAGLGPAKTIVGPR